MTFLTIYRIIHHENDFLLGLFKIVTKGILKIPTVLIYNILNHAPYGGKNYSIGSNFWKFYLIKTSFTFGEPVSLVKVFRLFRLEQIVLVFRVRTQEVDVQHLIRWQGQHVCHAFFILGEVSQLSKKYLKSFEK